MNVTLFEYQMRAPFYILMGFFMVWMAFVWKLWGLISFPFPQQCCEMFFTVWASYPDGSSPSCLSGVKLVSTSLDFFFHNLWGGFDWEGNYESFCGSCSRISCLWPRRWIDGVPFGRDIFSLNFLFSLKALMVKKEEIYFAPMPYLIKDSLSVSSLYMVLAMLVTRWNSCFEHLYWGMVCWGCFIFHSCPSLGCPSPPQPTVTLSFAPTSICLTQINTQWWK